MVPEKLIPRYESGSPDWLAYIRTTWPVFLAILGFTFWLGGRLESPESKAARIESYLRPIETRLSHIETQLTETEDTLQNLILEYFLSRRSRVPEDADDPPTPHPGG